MSFATGRIVLTIVAVIFGLSSIPAELSRSHVFNPSWPGHARFHVVTYAVMNIAACSVALLLLWGANSTRLAHQGACGLLLAAEAALFLAAVFPGTSARADGEPLLLRQPISLWMGGLLCVATVLGTIGILS